MPARPKSHPRRGIDHVVLCVRDLEAARAAFQHLGFTLTPHAVHPFGTGNSLVQLQGCFIELLTVVLIIGLAYLYNYSGMVYTLGLAIASVGAIFPFFSVFLGWIACFLSGSDTSSNALFGNLQVVAARQLKLSPVLMAATNSSGAVMGKMVSPQNVTTGVSTTALVGKEGLIVRRTIVHSLVLACILGVIVMVQQYLIPGIIP